VSITTIMGLVEDSVASVSRITARKVDPGCGADHNTVAGLASLAADPALEEDSAVVGRRPDHGAIAAIHITRGRRTAVMGLLSGGPARNLARNGSSMARADLIAVKWNINVPFPVARSPATSRPPVRTAVAHSARRRLPARPGPGSVVRNPATSLLLPLEVSRSVVRSARRRRRQPRQPPRPLARSILALASRRPHQPTSPRVRSTRQPPATARPSRCWTT